VDDRNPTTGPRDAPSGVVSSLDIGFRSRRLKPSHSTHPAHALDVTPLPALDPSMPLLTPQRRLKAVGEGSKTPSRASEVLIPTKNRIFSLRFASSSFGGRRFAVRCGLFSLGSVSPNVKKPLFGPRKARLKEQNPFPSPNCPLSSAQHAHLALESSFLRSDEPFF